MVVLLNLLPLLTFLGCCYLAYKIKKWWLIMLGVLSIALYFQIQPSYIHKGEVVRTAPPEFEQSDKKIEDRMSKPKSGEEYDKRRQDEYRKIDEKIEQLKK